MPKTRCHCPATECRAAFAVPDSFQGKTVLCPKCRAKLAVEAHQGQTTLVFFEPKKDGFRAKNSAPAPVVAPVHSGARVEAEPKKQTKRGLHWGWIVGGVLAVSVMVCGGLGAGALVLIRNAAMRARDASEKTDLPVILVDPAIANAHFEKWRKIRGQNGFGGEEVWLAGQITAVNKAIRSGDFVVEQFDSEGKKLDDDRIVFPKLKPGEKGNVRIPIEENTYKVVIHQKAGRNPSP